MQQGTENETVLGVIHQYTTSLETEFVLCSFEKENDSSSAIVQ